MALALVFSDNVAAEALARTTPRQPEALPAQTMIVDGCGIDPYNSSTARSIASLARRLYPTRIAQMSVEPYVQVGGDVAQSTNPFINKPGWRFYLSKTGWMRAAGGCLVVVMEIHGRPMTIVILGSPSVPQRWKDLQEIRSLLGG